MLKTMLIKLEHYILKQTRFGRIKCAALSAKKDEKLLECVEEKRIQVKNFWPIKKQKIMVTVNKKKEKKQRWKYMKNAGRS